MPDAEPTTIRPALANDIPRVLAIIARIYAEYGDVLDIAREDTHLRDALPYFRAGGGELWVAEVGGAVAGSCGVRIDESAAEIKTVYIAHEFRRRGLARRMVRFAIDHARSRGCAIIALWSDTRFAEAHRLYESLGFARTGSRDVSITNTFSEHRYEMPLDAPRGA